MGLEDQKCTPCEGGVEPFSEQEIEEYRGELDEEWEVVSNHHLRREFDFDDFESALNFVNHIGAIAEEEGHHPDIYLTWGEAAVEIYTHKIDGLHENDFILAKKFEEEYQS
ncbi:MAG: 4a-hydroxytetrahydrobiopterin dehydratase [Candidatus Nanohaloarchaea archaeon]